MAEVHDLLKVHGRQGVLHFDAFERRVVDAAAHYLGDEDGGIGFLYSGWAQAALPHKRLPDEQPWQVRTDRVNLVVEPGRRSLPGGGLQWVGVPYGGGARLIMLYLKRKPSARRAAKIDSGKVLERGSRKWGFRRAENRFPTSGSRRSASPAAA